MDLEEAIEVDSEETVEKEVDLEEIEVDSEEIEVALEEI